MNLLRIGDKAINLDRVEEVTYLPSADAGGKPSSGDRLVIAYPGEGDPLQYRGDEARAAWRVVRSPCRYGECDPPTVETTEG